MDMKAVISVLCCSVVAVAYAVTAPMPPPLPYADTESVTNVAFSAGVAGDNVFAFALELDATPSNNVEVASVNAEAVVKFGATKEPLTIRIR